MSATRSRCLRGASARGLIRGVHRPRVLDLGRVFAGIYTIFALRPAAQRRLHRDPELRPGRVHGDRRLHDGDPDRRRGGMNFWLSLPISIAVTIGFGLIIGLPSLRLRADYFAIARSPPRRRSADRAQRPRPHQRRPGDLRLRRQLEQHLRVDRGVHRRPRVDRRPRPVPAVLGHVGIGGPAHLRLHPHPAHALGARPACRARGRGRRPRAGQNAFSYKLQSLALAATTGAGFCSRSA